MQGSRCNADTLNNIRCRISTKCYLSEYNQVFVLYLY